MRSKCGLRPLASSGWYGQHYGPCAARGLLTAEELLYLSAAARSAAAIWPRYRRVPFWRVKERLDWFLPECLSPLSKRRQISSAATACVLYFPI